MYFLGIDLGSSFIKASLLKADDQLRMGVSSVPDKEMSMKALQSGWAEQSADGWWDNIKTVIKKLISETGIDGKEIAGIGISYQMHGLVLIDKAGNALRDAIIWCDSRAVNIGDNAFEKIGKEYCLRHLLNSPGNFTASKLSWVINNEPKIAEKIHHFLLPGDFINYKLSGEINTSVTSLSEGMFWDYQSNSLSGTLLDHYQIATQWAPKIVDTFSIQGELKNEVASELGMKAGTPICYRAGDQPNNAFSLNVNAPGEIATTAGTSGVVYGIQDSLATDPLSRINAFAHVNHTHRDPRIGILLCVNGTGIANSWIKRMTGTGGEINYNQLNEMASSVLDTNGIKFYPFGNGAERMLNNRLLNSALVGIDFNRHSPAHLIRAVQEGIVFALHYGTEIMKENGLVPKKIKAGKANMFLSPLFRQMFSTLVQAPLEFYDTDGATGAARGAGIGKGYYTMASAFTSLKKLEEVTPDTNLYHSLNQNYQSWKSFLNSLLSFT